jgi:hypothetical protein
MLEFFNAGEKKCANSDAMSWRLRTLSEPKIPADPLLHKRSTEAARETHAETDEPKDVYVVGITWRFEYVRSEGSSGLHLKSPQVPE